MRSSMLYLILWSLYAGQMTYAAMTVCYFGSWAVYNPPDGTFNVGNIDPFLCTHVIYAFAGVNPSTFEIQVLDPWNDLCPNQDPNGGLCNYDNFVALKQQNPDLVVTLAVGGGSVGSPVFSNMAADPGRRATFVSSTISLLDAHNFDGLDVDWEFPTQLGGSPDDKVNFVYLLQDLRAAFNAHNPPLRLTAALSAGKDTIDVAYDVAGISQVLDALHVMTYDFHGSWEPQTNHQSLLCNYPGSVGYNVYYNVNYAINYYVQLGAPNWKIVFGVPMYGNCWTLNNPDVNGIYAPANNPSPGGPITGSPGVLTNYEICLRFQSNSCTVVNDPNLNEPYFFCPDGVWCGYENDASAYKKARYAVNHGFGGVMVWNIAQEDFIPACASQSFPVIRQIKQALSLPVDADPFNCST